MKRLLFFSPLILAIPVGLLSAEIIIHAKTLMFWKMR